MLAVERDGGWSIVTDVHKGDLFSTVQDFSAGALCERASEQGLSRLFSLALQVCQILKGFVVVIIDGHGFISKR
jgi:hypothetical protein